MSEKLPCHSFACRVLWFAFFSCALFAIKGSSQGRKIDSLKSILRTAGDDTNKVNALNALSKQLYLQGIFDTALVYADNAKRLAEEINCKKGVANAHNVIGLIYENLGDNARALKEHLAALKIREEIGDKKGIAISHNNIGIVYDNRGDYEGALSEYLASLKIKEALGDKQGLAASHTNIGLIYYQQGKYPEALKELFASLKLREELSDSLPHSSALWAEAKRGASASHNNIGLIYENQGNYPDALKEYFAAMKIGEEIDDKVGIASCHNNIGNIYNQLGKPPDALREYFAALKIRIEIGEKQGIATSHASIGSIYYQLGNYPDAVNEYLSALDIFIEISDRSDIAITRNNIGEAYIKQGKPKQGREELMKGLQIAMAIRNKYAIKLSYNGLARADSALGNYKSALENYKTGIVYRDSLVNEANTKKTVRQQMQYEFSKKQTADSVKVAEEKKVATAELKSEQNQRYSLYGGLVLVIVFAGAMYNRFRVTQKQKAVIEEQKLIVEEQKKIVEEKNKDILDSIHYARRIQRALLPSERYLERNLREKK